MTTILVVEDDHNLGLMIKDILEFENYKVILTKKPLTTIEQLTTLAIDMVLLDKLISGVDGTDVCKTIRADNRIAQIPILMMSAMYDAGTLCMAAGASDFISKPFEMDEFLQKVETVLAKS